MMKTKVPYMMSPDLQNRILPAIIYVIVIAFAFLFDSLSAAILILLFYGICLYEYLIVSLGREFKNKIINSIGVLLVGSAIASYLIEDYMLHLLLACISVLFFTSSIIYLIQKKRSIIASLQVVRNPLFYIVLPFFLALVCIRFYDDYKILLLGTFIIIWLNDAGAYFVGRKIGKTKLFPSVSPGKTWEGLIGGAVLGILISVAVYNVFGTFTLQQWIIIAVILSITGTFGDLAESSWKRFFKIKDSSNLFPGHGGFLDRLDSFIYSIPFVTLFFLLASHVSEL